MAAGQRCHPTVIRDNNTDIDMHVYTHHLLCGHKVFAVTPTSCGENCHTPNIFKTGFSCPLCWEQGFKRVLGRILTFANEADRQRLKAIAKMNGDEIKRVADGEGQIGEDDRDLLRVLKEATKEEGRACWTLPEVRTVEGEEVDELTGALLRMGIETASTVDKLAEVVRGLAL